MQQAIEGINPTISIKKEHLELILSKLTSMIQELEQNNVYIEKKAL
jgi:hypothetical protein